MQCFLKDGLKMSNEGRVGAPHGESLVCYFVTHLNDKILILLQFPFIILGKHSFQNVYSSLFEIKKNT